MTDDDLDRRLRETLGAARASPDLVARLTASARPRRGFSWPAFGLVLATAATLALVAWPDAPTAPEAARPTGSTAPAAAPIIIDAAGDGLHAVMNVYDLDDHALAALDGHLLRDRPAELVPLEANFTAPPGSERLASPTLALGWGDNGMFSVGGDDDMVHVELMPYLDETGAPYLRLQATFGGMAADGESLDAPIPADTWSLGTLNQTGDAWILTTVTLEPVAP